jgi:DNA invertase Pin-like site-specific DNA recombinase
VLVVYSLSRLARSVRDTLWIAERLEAAGADLVSLSEQIDTTSAAGRMIFRLLAVMAEFERELIVERTRSAVAHKRSRGERLGQVPYGKRLAPDGRTLEPDPAGLEALELVARLKAEGRSVRAIARELTARGHPTKNGARCWAPSTVHELMRAAADGRQDQDASSGRPREPRPPAPRGDP